MENCRPVDKRISCCSNEVKPKIGNRRRKLQQVDGVGPEPNSKRPRYLEKNNSKLATKNAPLSTFPNGMIPGKIKLQHASDVVSLEKPFAPLRVIDSKDDVTCTSDTLNPLQHCSEFSNKIAIEVKEKAVGLKNEKTLLCKKNQLDSSEETGSEEELRELSSNLIYSINGDTKTSNTTSSAVAPRDFEFRPIITNITIPTNAKTLNNEVDDSEQQNIVGVHKFKHDDLDEILPGYAKVSKSKEIFYQPDFNYMHRHPELEVVMRAILIDWMM